MAVQTRIGGLDGGVCCVGCSSRGPVACLRVLMNSWDALVDVFELVLSSSWTDCKDCRMRKHYNQKWNQVWSHRPPSLTSLKIWNICLRMDVHLFKPISKLLWLFFFEFRFSYCIWSNLTLILRYVVRPLFGVARRLLILARSLSHSNIQCAPNHSSYAPCTCLANSGDAMSP